MATLDNTVIKVRADIADNWSSNNPALDTREIALDLTNNEIKIGTGANWSNTNNFIANNKAVKAADNKATSANSTATNAMNTANSAYAMAQQALTSSGRRMDVEIGEVISEQGSTLEIDEEFLKTYPNYNIDCLKGLDNVSFSIENFPLSTSEANDIIFNFYTKTSCLLKSSRFTNDIAQTSGGSILLVDVNNILQQGETQDEYIIPADMYVRILLHDTWLLKIEGKTI